MASVDGFLADPVDLEGVVQRQGIDAAGDVLPCLCSVITIFLGADASLFRPVEDALCSLMQNKEI